MTTKARGCKAKTKAGAACQAAAGDSGYCAFHDPALAATRASARRRGGESHRTPHSAAPLPPARVTDLDDVRAVLAYALAEALMGDNSIARGRLLVAIAQAAVEPWKIGELEQRLAALELAAARGGVNGTGH